MRGQRDTVGSSPRNRRGVSPLTVLVAAAVLAVAAAVGVTVHRQLTSEDPHAADYVPVGRLATTRQPPPTADASTGSYVSHCGRNENGHRNADNVITLPGRPGAAMHGHDYVGNLSTDAFSTDQSLSNAATTCNAGDRSTYNWPVLRVIGRNAGPPSPPVAGNTGRILTPDSVLVEFRGNATSNVVAMPRFLRALSGNAMAHTQQGLNAAHVQWGCSALPGKSTTGYPLCPSGQQVTRTFDFPDCWDGLRTDSPNHRAHVVFTLDNGACPPQTFPVPRLHIVLSYSVPSGASFAIDTMPEQNRAPITDHSDFIQVMPDSLMARVVSCVNSGRHCT